MTRISLLLIFLFFQVIGLAQVPGHINFSIDNGAPSNTVYDIEQDENGFIWIATDYGISKYDGISFKNYTITDGLPDNEVLSFFKDSKNRIWMLGFNGKIGFIYHGEIINSSKEPFLNELSFDSFITEVYEDSLNNLWFFRSIQNVKKLDKNNTISIHHFNNSLKRKRSKKIKLVEDKKGLLHAVISTADENNKNISLIASLNSEKWEEINLENFPSSSINKIFESKTEALKNKDSRANKISTIIFDHFDYQEYRNLIYNTTIIDSTTFLISNLDEGAILLYTNKNPQKPIKLLSSIQTSKAFIDNEKNIWVGSLSNGVFLFPNIEIKGLQFQNKKKNDIHSVSLFNDKIIIGNDLGEIMIVDKNKLTVEKTYRTDKFSERVRHIKKYKDVIYLASDQNIHTLNSDFEIERIQNMNGRNYLKTDLKNFKDISISDSDIYTANSNGVSKINTKSCIVKKLWDIRSSSLFQVNNDSIWIGTTNGLYLQKGGKTNQFKLNSEFDKSIIYSLYNSPHGLLIGSNSFGLGILNKNEVFTSISTKDGLVSNYIKSIFLDANNNIWLSTNFGLNSLTFNKNGQLTKIKSFTTLDGLFSNDVRNCFVDIKNNIVYAATSKGLNIIDLKKESKSILPPILHINEILVNNSTITFSQDQQFESDHNNFEFNYSGISFKSLGNITFKYRLRGIENEWIETKNNTVRYSSLPPNNYVFELVALSKNKIQSKNPVCFSFTITPPFYKTWWFILLMILLSILSAYYISQFRINYLKKEQEVKEQISALRYRALNAQMNPHFINNLIVNINSLADKGQLNEVKESLTKFSELVNLILQTTKSNLISLTDEIHMAELYLDLQKSRFNDRINYSINRGEITQDEIDNILVPPMILQPIIENSIKHGFKNTTNNNLIAISFEIENNDFIICKITDNGIGIQDNEQVNSSKNSGISLENINKRLELISDSNEKEKFIFITNITNEFNNLVGTKITLKIPLISY